MQANLLLQDHSERVHLQNGLVVELSVQGVVSMDLSGMISISLWNKHCNSLIKNRYVEMYSWVLLTFCFETHFWKRLVIFMGYIFIYSMFWISDDIWWW